MLEVQNLTKKYAKTLANDHLCFSAPAGEITVLLGPNGAGKSTAIKAIAGLLRFSGEIRIGGYPNKSIEAKQLLGYVPEVPAAYPMLSIEEHMQFIARAYSLKEGWEAHAQTLLNRFDLIDKREKLGKELSKGMQQKLSLCCALLTEPMLLLVDEPMVGLDPHAIKELKQVFCEERDRGAAVVISTHLLDSVAELWDRALILKDGRIAAERCRREVEENGESLEELFFEITEHQEAGAK